MAKNDIDLLTQNDESIRDQTAPQSITPEIHADMNEEIITSKVNKMDMPATVGVNPTSAVAIDMASKKKQNFITSLNIGGPRTWTVSNFANAMEFDFRFILGGAHNQTFPSNFFLNDPRWNNGTKVWAPLEAGTYFMRARYDGANWFVEINGPFV